MIARSIHILSILNIISNQKCAGQSLSDVCCVHTAAAAFVRRPSDVRDHPGTVSVDSPDRSTGGPAKRLSSKLDNKKYWLQVVGFCVRSWSWGELINKQIQPQQVISNSAEIFFAIIFFYKLHQPCICWSVWDRASSATVAVGAVDVHPDGADDVVSDWHICLRSGSGAGCPGARIGQDQVIADEICCAER